MQQTKTQQPTRLDQADSDLVRSRLRLAFLVFMAIVFFGQTDVFAEDITWSFTGVISSSDRPDIGQIGQIIELEFAIDESAENQHPSPDLVFKSNAIMGLSAKVNGVNVYGSGTISSNSILDIQNQPDVGIDTINWIARGDNGVSIRAFFRLPQFVLPSFPGIEDTFRENMIVLAGNNDSALNVCVSSTGPDECLSAVPMLTYMYTTPPPVDSDGDGVADNSDNCINVENASQLDSNADGFGNACDADLDNSCAVNFLDFSELTDVFFTNDADADFNGDGTVNFADLSIIKGYFGQLPGPSAQASCGEN